MLVAERGHIDVAVLPHDEHRVPEIGGPAKVGIDVLLNQPNEGVAVLYAHAGAM